MTYNNTILNCTFTHYNSIEGGAIYLSYPGNIYIKGCLFKGNYAEQGAAIYFFQQSSLFYYGNKFLRNYCRFSKQP